MQKTVEIPQVQALFAGSVLNTVEVPQLQYFDKVVDVPVEVVDVGSVQLLDKVVDMPVAVQRQVPVLSVRSFLLGR